ncbi:energy-coupling factor transporter ATPase [Paenalkalicoccus suaedae]|uniref:Energy-coupling factor transporter ATP-binding protein EcfA2 n=1 Tax=Paenalkalicoccus suaedae TaxID=2592382 RepID=A0A859FB03_9BACI|nr:energy-coupling factor transporter ATPase [Paenalkalicoccus suaedae]QKS69704.1 energy-coupling factor transporter ATPase [Paenalkalicoccus suaedae]
MHIHAKNVTHTYGEGSPFESRALTDVSVSLAPGSYTAIVGETGSGKSTFIQHLNGLLKPTAGSITIGKTTVKKDTKQKELYELRRHVGMVFQFSEHQLFDETVLQDVMFGPLNYGATQTEAKERAIRYLTLVGIKEADFNRSPFELSGGQKRRVAIAGVLACEPTVLVLDEPTAGLDPIGQQEVMELFSTWFKEEASRSIVLVTHQMNQVLTYAEHMLVFKEGALITEGQPLDIFLNKRMLGVDLPDALRLLKGAEEALGVTLSKTDTRLEAVADALAAALKGERDVR